MYAEPVVRYCIVAILPVENIQYAAAGPIILYTAVPPSGKTTILSSAYEARPLHLVGIVAFNSQIPWTLKTGPFKLIPNEILSVIRSQLIYRPSDINIIVLWYAQSSSFRKLIFPLPCHIYHVSHRDRRLLLAEANDTKKTLH